MRVLIPEPEDFDQGAVDSLRSAGFDVILEHYDQKTINQVISEYDGLIIRLGIMFDRELLAGGKKLKFIVTPTTGLDHIDLEAAGKLRIRIVSLKNEVKFLRTVTSTAELTWGLLLALKRNVVTAHESVMRGKWNRMGYVGGELSGNVLGIVGLGRLGQMLARYGRVFGMKVVYVDPIVNSKKYEKLETMNELAQVSDVISVHVNLDGETIGLIDKAFFQVCKKSAVLINTSRGAVVDEAALLKALEEGGIAGAAVDVLTGELKDIKRNRLVKYARHHNNLIITPHIGGASYESMRRVERFVVNKLFEQVSVKTSEVMSE